MKISELAELMGKEVGEVKEMLRKENLIELNLTERKQITDSEKGYIEIIN